MIHELAFQKISGEPITRRLVYSDETNKIYLDVFVLPDYLEDEPRLQRYDLPYDVCIFVYANMKHVLLEDAVEDINELIKE